MRFNLTPLTKAANNLHKSAVETDVKKWVNDDGLVMKYTVTALPEWGSSLSIPRLTRLQQQTGLTDAEKREMAALDALRHLTRGFVAEAGEIEEVKAAPGTWAAKSGGKATKATIPNAVQDGADIYGY